MNKHLVWIIFLFAFVQLETQELSEEFLESLPINISDDIKKSAKLETEAEQNIPSPETRIKNLEEALAEAKRTLDNIENDLNKDDNKDTSIYLSRFGESFFKSFQSTFLPINEPNFQPTYILDVGDIVTLQLIGQVTDTYELKIKRNGAINIPDVGDVTIAGLSLSEATKLVKDLTEQVFIGTDAYFAIDELRDMNIMIVGNVNNPGMYTLSGGSTALSVINAAGGIQENGSFREIEHRRDGNIINKVDLYDVFLNGDLSRLKQLRSGDSIIVKPVKDEIRISGGVSNPAIYELKGNESLQDILDYSGFKINSNSSPKLQIDRRNLGKYENLTVLVNDANDIKLMDGDSIQVPYVKPIFEKTKQVTITGEVKIPGTYFIEDNTSVSDIIKAAGNYTQNAFTVGGVLSRKTVTDVELRLKERSYNELVRFLVASQGGGSRNSITSESLITFLSLLKDYEPSGRLVTEFELSELEKNPIKDRLLEDGDKIHIPAFMNQVYVFGEVLNPSGYSYQSNLSVKDYLEMSGGFSRSADENKIILILPNGTAESIELGFLNSVFQSEQILPGSLIYVPQYIGKVEGINLASAVAPIISSFALSIASLNSINN